MSTEGFRLVIPQEMLNKLDAADKKLQALGNTSKKTGHYVQQSFGKMIDSVQAFINKVGNAQLALHNLGNFKGNDINLGNVSIQATQAADDVNKLVDVIAKLYAENEKIKNQQLSSRGITIAQEGQLSKKQASTRAKELLNDERELMNAQRERERELMRADKESAKRHALQMARYRQEIQEKTRFSRIYAQIPKTLSTKDAGRLIARSVQSDKSINQSLIAIKNLEKAKKDLDTTDRRYAQTLAKINSEIDRHKANLRKLGVETENVRKHQSNLMNHAQQLRRALALVFSVSQIAGYANKMIQIRGEFELQQRSLQAILQNKDEANKIWQQTVDLAVRSPFRVKELVTYTKQLASYRVETEKLHETTRMLSDVSAGLGVDMQRLILAYGQVKAANYLRGTELRQFSEAGINILGELSKYFTELEGRAVSVGDVFERVSKRMVAFSDVEEIFKRITSEGGIFYRMQEIQSETVKGLISNLYDQIDLMFNEIGKSNDGILKDSIGLLKTLVENWEVLAEALKGAVAAFALYKLNTLLAKDSTMLLAIDMGVLTDASQKQLKITQLLTLGWKRVTAAVKTFSKTLVSNPWILALTALIYTFSKLYNAWSEHQQQLDEITKQYKELRKEVSGISVNFTYAKDINEQKKELNKIINLAKEKYNIDVDINVNDLDEQEVSEKFNNLRNEILNTMAFTEQMSKAIVNSDTWFGNMFTDGIKTDFEEFSESAQELSTTLRNEVNMLIEYLEKSGQLTDELKEAFKPRTKDESELEYIERISRAYKEFYKANTSNSEFFKRGLLYLVDLWGKDLYSSIRKSYTAIVDFDNTQKEATKEFNEFADSFENRINSIPEEGRTIAVKTAIDQQGFDDFTREMWYRLANERFSVNIEIAPPKPAEVTGWQKEYNDYIAKLPKSSEGKSWLNDLSMESDVAIYTNNLKSNYERIDKITASWYAGNQRALHEYTKEQIIELEKQSKVLKQGYDWLVYTPTKKTDGGRDIFTDKLRVIKEIYQAYKDLGKTLDDVGAKEGAMQKFGNAFKEAFGKTPEQMGFDLFSEEGVKKAYDYLIKNAPNAKKKIQAELAKGEIVLETKVRLQQEKDKNFADQIADMFSGYELSLELQKLNIPPDLAQQLFGVETFDLSQIREKLEKEIADAEKQGGREDFVAERKKELEKVEEMERKAQEERLKRYSQFLIKGYNERINLKLQELRELELLEKDKEKLTPQQYEAAKKGIQDEYRNKALQQQWKDFEQSSQYINLFDDIENASTASLQNMKSKLDELKQSMIASGLPARDLKEILDQINKVEEELENRAPFKTFINDVKTAVGGIKEQIELRKEEKRLNEEINRLEKQKPTDEQVAEEQHNAKNNPQYQQLLSAQKLLGTLKEGTHEYEVQKALVAKLEKDVYPLTTAHNEITEDLKEQNKKLEENQGKQKSWVKAVAGVREGFSDAADFFNGMSSSVGTLISDLENGIGISDSMKDNLELIQGVMGGMGQISSGVSGLLSGKPLAMIQGGMNVLGGISNIIGSFNAKHDKKKERQIEREMKLVEKLKKVYEDLGETIEKTYSIDTLNEATKMSKQNIEEQIRATERMIAAEKGKKDTDWDRIEEWKEQIEEYKEMMKGLEETRLQELGAFASDKNKKSGAQAFMDAWFEAYKETGNGLSGLNEQFDEFFEDMIKKQMLSRGANQFLEPFFREFDTTIQKWSDRQISEKEALADIEEAKNLWMPRLDEFWASMADTFGVAEDLAGKNAELSGLQAGIQGITEDQADVLASYWSSVRFYVADTNEKFTNLVTRLFDSEGDSNPMLAELRAQTAFIREIRDSFGAVIGRGGNTHSGAYLKVAIG